MPFYTLLCVLLLSGCSYFISSATVDMTENLSQAILNNNDLATVEAGGPAYLLMVDSLLYRDPDNESLLRSAADVYTAYTDVFVKDKDRAKKLTDKALNYALRAMCIRRSDTCLFRQSSFQEFKNTVSTLGVKDVPDLFTLGSAWSAWIQTHREDWDAVAEIPRVEAIMDRVVELDDAYQDGAAHLYLGVLATLLPPALGGKPDVGKQHFERALEISKNKNLMVKVLYARHYARLVFDRELHDRLLNAVLKASPDVPGYTLGNTLAQQQARELLKSGEDYF
ncbi:MAG: TRAP transporter TatT component family protein [Deltaproteobacteria bacterium]|nr:TRAP transporter TatT component family protein [Deltaproteobacteria bacterium]